jgi:hypothetical protein
MHDHMNVKIGYCVIYCAPTQVSIKEQASYSAKQKCYIFVNTKNFDTQTSDEASQQYSRVFPSKFTSCIYNLEQLFRDIKTSS